MPHKSELIFIRNQTIKAAQDLRYPKEVIEKLMVAKSEAEMSNIMKSARKGYIYDK